MTGQTHVCGIHPPLFMQFNSSPDAVLRRLPRADSCYFPSISLTIQGRAAWFTLMLLKTSARWGERAEYTVWTGLMKDFPSDPSSLVHQKWDLLCLLAARHRALYTEIKNLSSAVTATNQDEPKALCSDDIYIYDKLLCSLKIPNYKVKRNWSCI